jgi:hypothetical protein
LRAAVTENVAPGVVVSPKGRWPSLSRSRSGRGWVERLTSKEGVERRQEGLALLA